MDEPEKIDPERLEDIADLLRAMAHPLRIAIIDLLADGKQLTVTQIQKQLGVEQAVTSHHLIILKNKEVLRHKRQGKTILYYLRNENITRLLHFARQSV
jgi:DNA-binding transcriptional ArsR family regulator